MSKLLDDLKAYEEGLITSINNSRQTGVIDAMGQAVLKNAQSIPGAAQAIQLANGLEQEVVKLTGAGSLPSRMADALLHSGNIFSAFKNEIDQIFNGRTFGTDSYLGAGDWMLYVQGINPGPSTGVPDDAVYPAMEWFINKFGVFISGRLHLDGLRKGREAYKALVNVCPETTQDDARIDAAVTIMQQQCPNNGVPKGWANIKGVFDQLLINIGNNSPSTLAYLKQQYQIADSAITSLVTGATSGNLFLYLGIGVALVVLIVLFIKK